MIINLTTRDRIQLYGIMPTKGLPIKLMALDDFKNAIKFSEEERKEFEFKEVVEGEKTFTTWNKKGVECIKEVEISEFKADCIRGILNDLGEEFPSELLNVYRQLNDVKTN